MIVCNDLSSIQYFSHTQKKEFKSIALVPTMGALHNGHLSLIETAKKYCESVVVSIFVNPAQFGPTEDFDTYPRTLNADLETCKSLHVDAVFCPTTSMIYPHSTPTTTVFVNHLSTLYCGKTRPHFFEGVTNVVSRLFNIIQPNVAVFGEKDFQQLAIIKQLVTDLHMPISVVGSPIIRNQNGLALSSRNAYLTKQEHDQASSIYSALLSGKKQFQSNLILQKKNLIQCILNNLDSAISVDYLVVVDATTLEEVDTLKPGQFVLFAGYLNKTRLIDNISI